MKRTVVTVILAVLTAAGAICGVIFLRQAASLRTAGEESVASAQADLAAAETKRDSVNPDTETGAAAWTAAEEAVYAEVQTKIDSLKAENTSLDESVAEVEAEVNKKLEDEDTAYYSSVYDEMQKGIDQVEQYLSGSTETEETDETEDAAEETTTEQETTETAEETAETAEQTEQTEESSAEEQEADENE